MGEFITDVIDIPELIGYVRESAVLQGPNLAGIIPPQQVDDIEYELLNIEGPNLQVARYRSWDAPPPVGKREGFATIKGEIQPLGLSMVLNEKELARLQNLRAGLPGSAQSIYDDALTGAMAAQLRIEVGRGDMLHDGKVTINENGCNVEANFGVPGTHLVTAGTAWSNHAGATPVTNLKAWEAVYRADNGGRDPDGWLISSEALADLTMNTEVKTLASGTSGVVPGIIGPDQVAQVLRAAGVRAPLIPFDGQVPDGSGVATPTIPVRDVVAFRRGFAQVFYGTSPTADVMVGNGIIQRREAAGIIAWAEQEIRPAKVITTGEAVALPVLRDPNALFRAIV